MLGPLSLVYAASESIGEQGWSANLGWIPALIPEAAISEEATGALDRIAAQGVA